MNGKRPAEPGPARVGKKGKKEVMAEFSDAVMEETLKKQVAEAWSRRTPFSHEVIVMDMDPFLHCVSAVLCPALSTTFSMGQTNQKYSDGNRSGNSSAELRDEMVSDTFSQWNHSNIETGPLVEC